MSLLSSVSNNLLLSNIRGFAQSIVATPPSPSSPTSPSRPSSDPDDASPRPRRNSFQPPSPNSAAAQRKERPRSVMIGPEGSREMERTGVRSGGVEGEAKKRREGTDATVGRGVEVKLPPEVLVIVRPPPTRSNNPMNLQIQLVTPKSLRTASTASAASAAPATRTSTDSGDPRAVTASPTQMSRDSHGGDEVVPPGGGASLSRSSSIRSNKSTGGASSVSVTSSASMTSGGRRLVPLYNLQYHNVLTTVITDAGTDAKVAKFQKRGLELLNLATIEPSETHAHLPSVPAIPLFPIPTTSSAGYQPPISPTPTPSSSEPKKFSFGKLFKTRPTKSESISSLSAVSSPPPSHSESRTFANPFASHSNSSLTEATLGTAPTLTVTGAGRPTGYSWAIRKWLRDPARPELGAEVVFHWERRGGRRGSAATGGRKGRSSSKAAKRASMISSISSRPTSPHPHPHATHPVRPPCSRSSSLAPSPSAPGTILLPDVGGALIIQRDTASPVPSLPSTDDTRSVGGTDAGDGEKEDGGEEEMDPEDDETPWTLTVRAPGLHQPLHLGTLHPAPHHPRIIGQLKVPFPLPSVPLASGRAQLTPEDLKDVLCCTCLWVVVREEFGGLGKRRKGDGWRIK